MDHKKIIIIGVIILGILALFMNFDYKKKGGLSGQAISPNILYLTSPVNSLSGVVDRIEGNKLTVSQKVNAAQNIAPLAMQTTPLPTPKTMTITYFITLTDKTQISQPPSFINYLFKTITTITPPAAGTPGLPTASAPKMTIKDIKVGQTITVNTIKDLRTLTGNTFEATMINLPQIANTLNGKIISLEGNILTIKGFSQTMAAPALGNSAPAIPQEKQYRISITSDTEISRNVYDANLNPGALVAPKSEKLTIADLKKDMQVSVYTAEDVTETQTLTALRIEPVQPILTPPIPSASTSPSIKP